MEGKKCRKCTEPVKNSGLCKTHYNERMRKYMQKRYNDRRDWAINELGGKCNNCGKTEGPFDIDHKDYKEKSFHISKRISSAPLEVLLEELKKCQLLCPECHLEKTRVDHAELFNKRTHWEHGTLSGYRHCKCDLCRKAKADHSREYKRKRRKEKTGDKLTQMKTC